MRSARPIGLALALTLGLSGCERAGSAAPAAERASSAPPAADHGGMHGAMAGPVDPDPSRNFARQMIVHHQGAVEMSEAALRQPLDPEMKALSEKILADQKREIAQMERFLQRTGAGQPQP